MASTLSRVTTFVPATPILSAEVNGELNQLVNLLNGTSDSIKAVIKVTDAGDPPLELNQLSTGPILELYQGGILKSSFVNDGGLSLGASLTIANANPAVVFDDTAGTDAKIDLDASVLRAGTTVANQVTLNLATGVVDFSQIPTLPASDPTTDNQASRKAYIDSRKTWWSANWTIEDPSVYPLNSLVGVKMARVPSGLFFVRFIEAVWVNGSASGSFTFEMRRRAFGAGSDSIIDDVTFNSGTAFGDVQIDLGAAGLALTSSDTLYPVLTARSSPLQRDVQIALRGWQTPSS